MINTTELALTEDQTRFLATFQEWLQGADFEFGEAGYSPYWLEPNNYMVLSGSAGTGKTYVSVEAIKLAIELGYAVIGVCAPTHKAVRVIADKLEAAGLEINRSVYSLKPKRNLETGELEDSDPKPGIYVGTMHQFITASPVGQLDDEDDSADFAPKQAIMDQPLAKVDLLVCDEGSMVSKQYFGYITEAVETLKIKALFIGDEFQLFPVEKSPETSPVFSIPLKLNLRQVVRYDGAILKEATKIRDTMEDELNVKPYQFRPYNQPDLTIVTNRKGYQLSDWFRLMIDYAKQMQADRNINQDWVRVLVYRRKTMEEINHLIRVELYGESAVNKFFEGEWLFTHGQCSPYIPLDTRLESIKTDKKLKVARIGNSKDFQIKGVRQVAEPIPNPCPELFPNFPVLLQQTNVVTFDAYNADGERDKVEFAVLTAPQLQQYSQNRQTLESLIVPMIQKLDVMIATSTGATAKQMRANRRILDSFLRHFGYCYNVAEETSTWLKDPVKPEDEDFTREVKENGRTVRKRVICKLQPGFCITTHKSQGSTINHVFIHYQDFFAAYKDMNTFYRLIYTALTRACESVKIFSLY